ncbi:MAG: ATP-binding protein [Leptolyngbyaceae cyanobacterium SL_7_1]|nr:ATP-binding protein [Leptolyngbyaceae cyanobacterium SL_7_1]
MVQIFGDFLEDTSDTPEFLLIGFSPSAIPLKQRWRNNGLSASFIADYLITFFPVDDNEVEMLDRRDKLIGAARYIANELLENAMKFNYEESQQPVSVKLELKNNCVVFWACNAIDPTGIEQFQAFIQELITKNPSELLIRQVEKNSVEEWESSGLGLLTIMDDYAAKLGWKFDTLTQTPCVTIVTTTVQLFL